MSIPEPKTGINEAVRLTTQAIASRATRFRNFIIVVVVVGLVFVIWAGISLSWRPLLGPLLHVPVCGIFLYLDARRVNQWQHQILEMWTEGGLDLKMFVETVTLIRTLPPQTLHGMLNTLPTMEGILSAAGTSPDVRRVVSITLGTINRCQGDRTIFATLALALGLAAGAIALLWWSWLPLPFLLLVPLVICGGRWLNSARLGRWKRQMLDICRQRELGVEKLVEIAAQLDWEPVSDRKRDKFLGSLAE